MNPKKIFTVADIPLSLNGKTDRKKSIQLVNEILETLKENSSSDAEVEAMDNVLKTVRTIWLKALDLTDLDVNQDLYDIGADSVIISSVSSELNKTFDDRVAFDKILIQMLNCPTVKATADYIKELLN